MKLIFNSKELQIQLSQIEGAVGNNKTLPILEYALFKIRDGLLTISAFDNEKQITSKVPMQAEDIQFTVPFKKLNSILKSVEQTEVVMSVNDMEVLLKIGRSNFKLKCMPSEDFPSINLGESSGRFKLPRDKFVKLLKDVQFSMANQDVRYFLNGICLEIEGTSIKSISTDGHRLSLSESELNDSSCENTRIIIPRDAVAPLINNLSGSSDEIEVSYSLNSLTIQTDFVDISVLLIDGQFPDYKRVIPRNNTNVVKTTRSELLQVLKQASILADEKFRGVRLGLETNNIVVSSNNRVQESFSDSLIVDYRGEMFEIGFNVQYLVEAINACPSEDIVINLLNNVTSVTIQSPDSLEVVLVVMPMRL